MNSKIATEERQHFRQRLHAVLRKAGVPATPASVAAGFNLRADGATVTNHAVRKWLVGEAIPTHERLLILAAWLGVHPAWLLYGDAENSDQYKVPAETSLPTEDLVFLRDVGRLSANGKEVLRQVLDVLLRTMGDDKDDRRSRERKG